MALLSSEVKTRKIGRGKELQQQQGGETEDVTSW
jgi:hypothetical protein